MGFVNQLDVSMARARAAQQGGCGIILDRVLPYVDLAFRSLLLPPHPLFQRAECEEWMPEPARSTFRAPDWWRGGFSAQAARFFFFGQLGQPGCVAAIL